MTNFTGISDEDVLFSRYLVELHITTAEKAFEEDPPRHPRLLELLKIDLKQLQAEKECLDKEIKKRHLKNKDLWYGREILPEEQEPVAEENVDDRD